MLVALLVFAQPKGPFRGQRDAAAGDIKWPDRDKLSQRREVLPYSWKVRRCGRAWGPTRAPPKRTSAVTTRIAVAFRRMGD